MGHLRQNHSDAVLAILTGDHVIQGDHAFCRAFGRAVKAAEEKAAIVMIGIPPSVDPEPWRRFGCLRTDGSGRVTEFCEKPSLERAQDMIAAGGWQWNSGMFFFRISIAESALERFQPEMFRVYQAMTESLAKGKKAEAAFRFEDFSEKIPHPLDPGRYVDNSIDYSIMTPLVARPCADFCSYAVAGDGFRWTDLGQWDALRKVAKPDRKGTIRIGKTGPGGDVRDSILVAQAGYKIAADGVRNLIVAFGRKTALVAHASQLSRVKEAAQEALKHPDRVVMEHEVTDCDIQASGGRVIALGLSGISIRLKGSQLILLRRAKEAI
jgi:mannose-1-phosphate guanylyltransferase